MRLAGDLVAKYGGMVDRLVLYNAAGDTAGAVRAVRGGGEDDLRRTGHPT